MSAQEFAEVVAALAAGLVAILGALGVLYSKVRGVEQQLSDNAAKLDALHSRDR